MSVVGEITIKRPAEDVFDVVADARNEPRYNPVTRTSEQLTAGPIGAGTRFQDETRIWGRRVEILVEHTSHERPHRLTSAIHMLGADILGTLTFDPAGEGTRLQRHSSCVGGSTSSVHSSHAWVDIRRSKPGPGSSGIWKSRGTG